MANESPRKIIHIDENLVQSQLKEVVRGTVEETLNAMLDAEADRLCNAERYERTEARKDTRAGVLQQESRCHVRQITIKGPEASEPALRNGNHRTIQAKGNIRRRSSH